MERVKNGLVRTVLTAFLPFLIAPDINGQVTPPPEGPEIIGVNNRIRILASCASHEGEKHLDVTVKGPPQENWLYQLRPGEEGYWIKVTDDSGKAVLGGYSILPSILTQTFHDRVKSIMSEESIPLDSGREYLVEVLQKPYTKGVPDLSKLYDRATFTLPFNCAQ